MQVQTHLTLHEKKNHQKLQCYATVKNLIKKKHTHAKFRLSQQKSFYLFIFTAEFFCFLQQKLLQTDK